jgi:acyl carrier protein
VNATEARSLLTRLLGRIAPEAELDALDPDAPLQEALDLDSMDFLNLVTAVEEETGREVPERDYPTISTLAAFSTYITG